MRSKYRTKKLNYKVSAVPKKSKRADLRNYTTVLTVWALNLVLFGTLSAFEYKTWFYPEASNSTSTSTSVVVPDSVDSDSDEVPILSIDPEQIENLVNTEAFTHAIWPGYKGDKKDGNKVRNHFSQNLAEIIVNSGGVEVNSVYKVHFYYVVRDDGGIQFLSLVSNGRTTENTPLYIIRHAQKLVNIGVPGISPGTDINGDPITVVYELVIVFKPAY